MISMDIHDIQSVRLPDDGYGKDTYYIIFNIGDKAWITFMAFFLEWTQLQPPEKELQKEMTKKIQKGMTTPSNTPDARFEAVSEKSHVNLEGMKTGF